MGSQASRPAPITQSQINEKVPIQAEVVDRFAKLDLGDVLASDTLSPDNLEQWSDKFEQVRYDSLFSLSYDFASHSPSLSTTTTQ